MSNIERYSEFNGLTQFGIVAEGGCADQNLLPAHQVGDLLSGLTNIARRTTLLCASRPIGARIYRKHERRTMVLPPSRGASASL